MKLWEHYYRPSSVDEAASLLAKFDGDARVIAGGTDLLVDLRAASSPPVKTLVDVTGIGELTGITEENGTITIGAGVTHTDIIRSELIAERATSLVESCGVIGGPQVRNVATLGGNVAHALPAGDGSTSLVALDAEAEIYRGGKREWVPILDMYRGPGKSLIDPTRELLLKLRFDLCQPGEASAFKRVMRPQGVALPILGCATWLKLDAQREKIEAARICIGPVAPTPMRAEVVEKAVTGKALTEEVVADAAAAAQRDLQPRTSKYRATAEYRGEIMGVLVANTLEKAWMRAKTGEAIPEGVGLQ